MIYNDRYTRTSVRVIKTGILVIQSLVVTIHTTMFNIYKFCFLPTQCIYVFCVDLRKNSHYFPI